MVTLLGASKATAGWDAAHAPSRASSARGMGSRARSGPHPPASQPPLGRSWCCLRGSGCAGRLGWAQTVSPLICHSSNPVFVSLLRPQAAKHGLLTPVLGRSRSTTASRTPSGSRDSGLSRRPTPHPAPMALASIGNNAQPMIPVPPDVHHSMPPCPALSVDRARAAVGWIDLASSVCRRIR